MYLFHEPFEEASASVQMALDAVLSATELDEPVLRLYSFSRPAVTLGFRQTPEDCLHPSGIMKHDLEVSFRSTGGKSVLHQNSLTYSIVAPKSYLPSSIADSYRVLCGPILEALQTWDRELRLASGPMGSCLSNPVCFQEHEVESILTATGAKLVGSAQRRLRRNVLQHGEIRLFPPKIPEREIFKMDSTRSQDSNISQHATPSLFSEFNSDLRVQIQDEIRLKFEILFGKSRSYRLRCPHDPEVENLAYRFRVDLKQVQDRLRHSA